MQRLHRFRKRAQHTLAHGGDVEYLRHIGGGGERGGRARVDCRWRWGIVHLGLGRG